MVVILEDFPKFRVIEISGHVVAVGVAVVFSLVDGVCVDGKRFTQGGPGGSAEASIDEAGKADRVGLMRNGKLLAEDDPSVLMSTHDTNSLEEVFLKLCKRSKGVKE